MLLLGALLLPPSSKAQFIVVGQACGAGGLTGIANDGTPVVCRTNPPTSSSLVWVAVGGGGSSTTAGQFNVKAYGAIGDAKSAQGCTVTINLPTVVCPLANWAAADVNKIFWCVDPATGGARIPFNAASPMATIVSVQNATHLTASTNANGTATVNCVWGTQEEDTAITAAATAAGVSSSVAQSVGQFNTNSNNGPTLVYTGTIFTPPGGYIIKDTAANAIYNCQSPAAGLVCPSFVGGGSDKTVFYAEPVATGALVVVGSSATVGEIGGFTITSVGASLPLSPIGGLLYLKSQGFDFYDVHLFNVGGSGGTNNKGIIICDGCQYGTFRNIVAQNGSVASNMTWLLIENGGGGGVTVRDSFFSNMPATNILLNASGGRSTGNAPITFEGILIDECTSGNGACLELLGSQANFIGGNVFGGSTGAIHVDGTSKLWLSDSNVGAFTTANAVNALNIDTGGFVYSTGNTLRGNGTGFVLNGVAGSTYVDAGLNTYQNCVNTVCTNISPANYATQFSTGGILQKSSLTHTPNTCYAVTGNLLATAQNLCIILLDQNYQLLTITAQSGGTTPANSSCATPPVITFSDGTRSATLTMTSGKTQWLSSVDAVTNLNQVFANAATLTVSISANTCATPPSNVSVNYDLQSVLNP